MRRLMLLVALSIPVGCDKNADTGTDDTDDAALRLAIGAAVQDNLAGVKDGQASLATAVAQLDKKVSSQLATLDALDSKVDALASKIETAQSSPSVPTPVVVPPTPPPPVRPGRPDPAVTYKVTLDDAETRGPDTALVTIVTWSDFQ